MDVYRGFELEHMDKGWYATTLNRNEYRQLGPFGYREHAMYEVDVYWAGRGE